MSKLQFFVDFDGTITQNDVVDLILERFADARWKQIETLWATGEIGSRECLLQQFGLVKAKKDEFLKLLDEVKLDPYFEEFTQEVKAKKIPTAVVSDGLDFVIKRTLGKTLPIYANHFSWDSKGPKFSFAKKKCAHGCANCKVAVIKKFKKAGRKIIFIGDGLSDRFAAEVSDLVFAKGKLLTFCREKKIPYIEYKNFKTIIDWMKLQLTPSPSPSHRGRGNQRMQKILENS